MAGVSISKISLHSSNKSAADECQQGSRSHQQYCGCGFRDNSGCDGESSGTIFIDEGIRADIAISDENVAQGQVGERSAIRIGQAIKHIAKIDIDGSIPRARSRVWAGGVYDCSVFTG